MSAKVNEVVLKKLFLLLLLQTCFTHLELNLSNCTFSVFLFILSPEIKDLSDFFFVFLLKSTKRVQEWDIFCFY